MKWMARVKLKRRRRADLDPAEPAGLPGRAHSRSYAACSKHLSAPAETFEKDKEGSASQDRGIANWSPAPQVCCIDGDSRDIHATVRGARINPKKVRA